MAEPVQRLIGSPLRASTSTSLDWLDDAARAEAAHVTLAHAGEGGPERRGWAELREGALRVAAALAARGVGPGDRVVIALPTSFEFLHAFFGAQATGAVPVPTYPPTGLRAAMGFERLLAVAEKSAAKLAITEPETRERVAASPFAALAGRMATPAELAGAAPLPEARPVRGDDVAFVQFTSGSTARPKGAVVTHAAVAANVGAIQQLLDDGDQHACVSWLPLYHDMGLVGCLFGPLAWKRPLHLMPPQAFLRRPGRWLAALTETGATISAAPNFAFAFTLARTTPDERAALRLERWRYALCGAEPVSLDTLHAFAEALAPAGLRPSALRPVYGLAECTLAATLGAPGRDQSPGGLRLDRAALGEGRVAIARGDDASAFAAVDLGVPVPGCEIAIAEPGSDEGQALPAGRVGEVIVRGASLMRGYENDPEATAEALRAGWLRTGDLGFVTEGRLFLTGRLKNVVIVRGRNVVAEDVESLAEAEAGVRAGGAYAFGVADAAAGSERLVLVAEVESKVAGSTEEARALVGRVRARLGAAEIVADELVLVRAGTLPRTPSGKKQRGLARALLAASRLERV